VFLSIISRDLIKIVDEIDTLSFELSSKILSKPVCQVCIHMLSGLYIKCVSSKRIYRLLYLNVKMTYVTSFCWQISVLLILI
jgi:hypothetical protein